MEFPRFKQADGESLNHELNFTGESSVKTGNSRIKDFVVDTESLNEAIRRTQRFFLKKQHADGHWCGELEGDSILESEYILLLAYLGELKTEHARQAGKYLLKVQNTDGSWSLYPGGPLEISASLKAYLALKLLGHDINAGYMIRAREAILLHGGAEGVNSFTRYYLALLGLIDYSKCPAVPPEMILLPKWFPINLSAMSAWSRTIVVPLAFLWAYKPKADLEPGFHIRELFLTSPEALPVTMPESKTLDKLTKRSVIPWRGIFNFIDRCIKGVEFFRLTPVRGYSLKKCMAWMLRRF